MRAEEETLAVTAIRDVTIPSRREAVSAPASLLGRLGSWSYRHRRLVLAGWLVLLVLVSLAGRIAGAQFKNDLNAGSATESRRTAAFLKAQFPGQAGDSAQVVFRTRVPVTSAAAEAWISRTLGSLAGLPQVASVRSPFAPGVTGQVSRDGHIAYGVVQFDGTGDAIPDSAVQRVIDQAQSGTPPGSVVQLGGTPVQKVQKPQFGKSESLGEACGPG